MWLFFFSFSFFPFSFLDVSGRLDFLRWFLFLAPFRPSSAVEGGMEGSSWAVGDGVGATRGGSMRGGFAKKRKTHPKHYSFHSFLRLSIITCLKERPELKSQAQP